MAWAFLIGLLAESTLATNAHPLAPVEVAVELP
jgi:hypothetical protein